MTPGEEAALAFVADLAKDVEAEVLQLRADKAELVQALAHMNGLVARVQEEVVRYLVPDGIGPQRFVDLVISLLDGAEQKAAQDPAEALIKKHGGQS